MKISIVYNIKALHLFVCLIVIILYSECNYFCGKPEGRQKVFIDSLNTVFNESIKITEVPCYPGYIQAKLKTSFPDSVLLEINELTKKEGYVEFLAYDKNNKLIMGNNGSM